MTPTASAACHRIAAAPVADPLPFPDELLEEIFLRLGGAADLARASSACASFRRVATARHFLRRFRSVHAPPVLGFLDIHGFQPASPPHRSAHAAAALARDGAVDFTFSFLPDEPSRWAVVDTRDDGLVLLSRSIVGSDAFADLVVCDPLYRRYALVPPIPDDLAASVPQYERQRFISFLVPADEEKEKKKATFSLICAVVDRESKAMAFVFRSGGDGGNWQGITNHTVVQTSRPPLLPQMLFTCAYQRSYVHGCFYWIVDYSMDSSYLLVLDTREMKLFATIDLPFRPNNGARVIMDAGKGMLGVLTIDAWAIRLFRRTWRNNGAGVGAEEWQPYRTAAPLPRNPNGNDNRYDWFRVSVAAGVYMVLIGREFLGSGSLFSYEYHTLDLRTLLLERLCVLDRAVLFSSHLYSSFPPPFAPPRI